MDPATQAAFLMIGRAIDSLEHQLKGIQVTLLVGLLLAAVAFGFLVAVWP